MARTGDGSGGGGGAMSATLVSSIPCPPILNGTNVVATNPRACRSRSRRSRKRPPDAIRSPDREAKRKPWEKAPRSTAQAKPEPVEEASNVVPFGQGGP